MESQAKLSFEGTFYKRIQDTDILPVPLFLVVLHPITIYIGRYHFYNFLGPNPAFAEKDFCYEFSFFNGFTQTPQPPNR